jgi:hypothetical protein
MSAARRRWRGRHGECGFDLKPATMGASTLAAVDDAEIEAMDEAAVAALLAEVPHARPRPFP